MRQPFNLLFQFTNAQKEPVGSDLAGKKCRTLGNSLTWRIFLSAELSTHSFVTYDGVRVSDEQNKKRMEAKGGSPRIRQDEVVAHPPRFYCQDAAWRRSKRLTHFLVRRVGYSIR